MKENKLIPKRRFKEFENDEAWEQRKVKNVCEISTGKSNTQDRIEDGIYPFYVRSSIIERSNRYLYDEEAVLTVGDGVGTGKVYHYVNGKYDLHQRVYRMFDFKNGALTKYFYHYFANHFYNRVMSMSAKTSVDSVRYEMIAEMDIMMPSEKEQTKIIEFFNNLDNLVILHQRKLKKLKETKSAYLSEMFPKEGEKYPKRRFAGFTEPWEEYKLGELTSLITKGTTPLDKSGDGKINFIKIENIDQSSSKIISTSKISKEEHDGYLKRSQLQENDILFSIAGTLGRVSTIKKDILPANTNQALAIIRLKRGHLSYIRTYLKGKAVSEYIKKNPTIGAQPNLSLEQVGNLEISLPKNEEQRKIGHFFTNLDNLIALHQHKLEKLENLKKAYLNEMFV